MEAIKLIWLVIFYGATAIIRKCWRICLVCYFGKCRNLWLLASRTVSRHSFWRIFWRSPILWILSIFIKYELCVKEFLHSSSRARSRSMMQWSSEIDIAFNAQLNRKKQRKRKQLHKIWLPCGILKKPPKNMTNAIDKKKNFPNRMPIRIKCEKNDMVTKSINEKHFGHNANNSYYSWNW